MGRRVVAMRSPSAKRSCTVSACSIILLLVTIHSDRVDDIFVGGVICMAEMSLPRSRWSLEVVCLVASRISSDHWASKGCEIGHWNRIDLGCRVRMWCLLWSVGVGVVEVCVLWL